MLLQLHVASLSLPFRVCTLSMANRSHAYSSRSQRKVSSRTQDTKRRDGSRQSAFRIVGEIYGQTFPTFSPLLLFSFTLSYSPSFGAGPTLPRLPSLSPVHLKGSVCWLHNNPSLFVNGCLPVPSPQHNLLCLLLLVKLKNGWSSQANRLDSWESKRRHRKSSKFWDLAPGDTLIERFAIWRPT